MRNVRVSDLLVDFERACKARKLFLPPRPLPEDNSLAELRVRAHSLGALGRLAEATASARELVRRAPEDSSAWTQLGRLLLESGDKDSAKNATDRSLALDPTRSAPWNNLGLMLQREGKWHEAVEAFDRALDGRELVHERDEAFSRQSRESHDAMDIIRILLVLFRAIEAEYCAFPVGGPWLSDEDWPSLLVAPHYPDFFVLPQSSLPSTLDSSFRGVNLTDGRSIATVMPMKFTPADSPLELERSDRDLELARLRRLKAPSLLYA